MLFILSIEEHQLASVRAEDVPDYRPVYFWGNMHIFCLRDITGWFGVLGENDNRRRVIDICAERGLYVSNTYFEPKSLYKYTRATRGQDGVEVMRMLDLVLVKRDMMRYVQGMRAVRGMERGLSGHHVVLCKVRLVVALVKRRKVVNRARRIKSEKLREHQYAEGYVWGLDSRE